MTCARSRTRRTTAAVASAGGLGAALLVLLTASPASAAINDRVEVAPPSGEHQRLTVTMQDDALSAPVALVATYRAVPPTTTTVTCPPQLSGNADTRLFEVTETQPYTVQKSVDVPLSLHVVCLYRAGTYTSGVVLGTVLTRGIAPPAQPTGKLTPQFVRVLVNRTSAGRGQLGARIAGLRGNRGTVRLQVRVGKRWRTRATASVRRGQFLRTVRLRRGQRWRVYVPATRTTAAAASRAIRVGRGFRVQSG